MKKTLTLYLSIVFMFSCNSDDNQQNNINSDVVGNWKLIEVYADPGDGSGDFVPVESEKTITFTTNGTMSSNANLCLVFSDPGETSIGTYSESDTSITITDCEISPVTAYYEIATTNLIVSYFCIEGCQEKYEKVD